MSDAVVDEIGQAAESVALDAAWSQWSSLSSTAASDHGSKAWTVIDPEALVLASLALVPIERRLEDLVASWAGKAGFLMSKPRFKTLVDRFPPDLESRLGDFASYAAEGGDRRWQSWAAPSESHTSRRKSFGPLRLRVGPALIVRLRAGFGVNAKADVLGILLGLHGKKAALKELAIGAAYTERMVRTATEEMEMAGFIFEIEGRPSSFYADFESWAPLLETWPDSLSRDTPIPPWRPWSTVFAFLCHLSAWARTASEQDWTSYVAGSRARDLYEAHRPDLQRAGITKTIPKTGGGETILEEMREVVGSIRAWIEEGV